jgi:hypothetical protein
MFTSLVPEWLDEFCSDLISKSFLILGHCTMNLNIPAKNYGPFRWDLEHKIAIFSEMALKIFIKFQ